MYVTWKVGHVLAHRYCDHSKCNWVSRLGTELELGLPVVALLLRPKGQRSRSQGHEMSQSDCSEFIGGGGRVPEWIYKSDECSCGWF